MNAFTVDLEDWYQGIEWPLEKWPGCAPRLEIGLKRVLDLLEKFDFTAISSFNGRSNWFYDGVHITRRNTNRVITAVKGKAGESLK